MVIAVQNDAIAASARNVSSLGVSLNVAGGATLVVIWTSILNAETISSVTSSDGGDTVLTASDQTGTGPGIAVHYILNPVVNATKTLTANLSAGTADVCIGASSFTGTVITSAVDHTATNTGSSTTPNTTFTANTSDGMIIWGSTLATNRNQTTYGAVQLERFDITLGGGEKAAMAGTSEILTASGSNNQTSVKSGTDTWRTIAVEFIAAVGAARRIFLIT